MADGLVSKTILSLVGQLMLNSPNGSSKIFFWFLLLKSATTPSVVSFSNLVKIKILSSTGETTISETVAGRASPFRSASEVLVAFSKWPMEARKVLTVKFDASLRRVFKISHRHFVRLVRPCCLKAFGYRGVGLVLSCSSRPDLFCKYGRWLFPYKGRWSCRNKPLRLWHFWSVG